MKTHIIEITSPAGNFGKFLLGKFEPHEHDHPFATLNGARYLRACWTEDHLLVLDLETGEGALFLLGGLASADLDKHRIWVCPMFQPFLEWLYRQDLSAGISTLPAHLNLDAPFALWGYRRPGPIPEEENP